MKAIEYDRAFFQALGRAVQKIIRNFQKFISKSITKTGPEGGIGAILEDLGGILAPGSAQNRKKLPWDIDFGTPVEAICGTKIDMERYDFSKTSRHGLRKRFLMVLGCLWG